MFVLYILLKHFFKLIIFIYIPEITEHENNLIPYFKWLLKRLEIAKYLSVSMQFASKGI